MSKKIFIVFLLLLSTKMIFSQTGWYQQESGTQSNLYSVFFIDAATGYAVGDSAILKTSNGGTNWSKQYTQYPLRSVFFTDANTGYTCGGNTIYKTISGGITWNTSYMNNDFIDARSIYFVNSTTGVVAGSWRMPKLVAGAVINTTNGGVSWNYSVLFFPQALYCVSFGDVSTGYASGTSPFCKTTNSGQNWSFFQSGPPGNIYSICFINASTGWTAGGTSVSKTTNGGNNWLTYTLAGSLYSIHFANDMTGWVCGSGGTIYQSTNGGANWTMQSSGTTTYFYSLFFIDAQTGWAVGANGRILKTTNGGITSIQPISNEIPDEFKLYQNYPNPFNPVTKIKFSLPAVGQRHAFDLRLIVYDVLAKEVQILVNDKLCPGTYEVDFDGSNLPSGVYYYKLEAGNYTETRKMVLIK